MPLSIFLTPHDVEVYRTEPGADRPAGVRLQYFQSLADCRRYQDDSGQWWTAIECREGGTIHVPMSGPTVIFSEPERH